MQVLLAKHAGFCPGVRSAVGKALELASRGAKVHTLGPLVHNEAVAARLARQGVKIVADPEEAAGGVLLIRTHGVTPAVLERAGRLKDLTVVDATCPRVKKVQQLAAALAARGVRPVIYGRADHPEVKGVLGWAGGEAEVISSVEELERLEIRPPAALLAQTTGEDTVFKQITEAFLRRVPGGEVYDTICPETRLRQREALRLAQEVDAVVVVGGAASANTAALVEICRPVKPTVRVAGAGELAAHLLRGYNLIGVTAGASTPHWTIKEVVASMVNENEKVESGNGCLETVSGDENPGNGDGQESPGTAGGAEIPEAAGGDQVPEAAGGEENPDTAGEERFTQAAGGEETPVGDRGESDGAAGGADPGSGDGDEDEEAQFAYDREIKVVQVGEQVGGQVVRVTPDEVFIDIGAKTEAVLPVSELYRPEGKTLTELFQPGDEIEVTVINVDEQEGKAIVSHKRLAREKRWRELEQALENETTEEGTVKQVVPAGMVVGLGAGIEGFMPGSLVDLRYIPDFKHFLGETVKFKVIEYNRDKDKVILSRKKVLEEENARRREETIRSLEIGSIIPGTVRRLTDFGAFVDVGGIDGLVHVSEISWERVAHPQDVLRVGDEIKVKVLDVIPEKERISLSLRQTEPDPWTKAMQELKAGQIVRGKITRLVNFGAFVELRAGVEGLVHISQIADYHLKHPSEVLREGEEIDVKILDLKPGAKRISLSVREAGGPYKSKNGPMESGAENGNITLGDVFGGLFEQEQGVTAPEVKKEEGETPPPPEKGEAAEGGDRDVDEAGEAAAVKSEAGVEEGEAVVAGEPAKDEEETGGKGGEVAEDEKEAAPEEGE